MRKVYLAKHFRAVFLVFSFLIFAFWANAGTYYLTAAGQGSAQTPGNWNTNPAGGGTAATTFTNNNDIFIIPVGITGTLGASLTIGSSGSSGAGVTLQVNGSLSLNNAVGLSLTGKNGNQSAMTVNGTIIFSGTSVNQISLLSGTTFTLSSGATLRTANTNGILGTTGSISTGTSSLSTGANYEFNGTATQATLGLPATVNTLTINNAAGVNLNAATTVSTLTIGSVTANSILNDNGKQITSSGTINISNSGIFNIGIPATNTAFPAFTANNILAGTTVNYNAAASQTIAAVNYGNLTSINAPRVLASSGTIGIKGTFLPNAGTYTITGSTVSFNGSGAQTIPAFNYNNLTVTNTNTNITLAGSGIIGIAGIFTPGASSFGTITNSTVSFNGTAAQTIPSFTFNNLTINNPAGISSIAGNITINQSLALTNGIVTTGANKIIISTTGFVSRTNGWVAGNLQEYISSLSPVIFPIGDGTTYRPLTINFSTITTAGNLTASVTQSNGLHPQIASSGLNSSKTLLRYWNLTSGGLAGAYDATFGFAAADIPVGAATGNFVVRNYNTSAWSTTTTGTAAATSTQATGLTTFGEFAIGEPGAAPVVATQPANVTICSAGNTSFTTASGSNPTPAVKWQYSNDGGTTWVDIDASTDGAIYTNFTSSTLNITNAPSTINGHKYRSVYTNINGFVSSNAAILTVTTPPTAVIDYPGSPFGSAVSIAESVTLTGTGAYTIGIYSATPAGLSINSANGDIMPNTSTIGTYTVTYTIAAAGGCSLITTTASVTITLAPTAEISYAGTPFCTSVGISQAVTRTGTGNYTGGTYTSASGLIIDATTGAITPGSSTPGTYTITYHIPASAPYPASITTVDVTITAVPTASISYAGGPFCTSDETPQTATLTGTGAFSGGVFSSSPSGLSIDAGTGAFNPSLSSGKTYTITYTIPATGGCSSIPVTRSVTLITKPDASLTYSGSPFCQATTSGSPTLTGTSGGTYSSSPGLIINSSTGDITPNTSTAGDYVVIYTIPASGPCGVVQITALVTIAVSPTGTIDYAGQPFCSAGGSKSVTLTGTDAYTGGTFTSSPAGLIINSATGDISPASSIPNTYTVTYTTLNCPVIFTASVEITAAPTATISYSETPFCQSDGALKTVTLTGDNNGTFSAAAGLSINSGNGDITPSTSSAGTYVVTYTIPASGTCPDVLITTSVTITVPPTATISYAGTPFCKSLGTAQPVTLNGTNAYSGGTYSSTPGLIINSSTGAITPATSTAGNYLVTYTIPATGGCSTVPATTSVTITAVPTATITYSSAAYCITDVSGYSVNLSGTDAFSGGTFSSSPAGLSIDVSSGSIIPSGSAAGTYTVTYTIPSSAGCAAVPVHTSIIINADATVALTSALATTSQTVCINNAITNITYTIGGSGTGASVTPGTLPAGVTGSYNPGTKVFTISGTPTTSGSFSYTVTTTGPCINNSLSGTITINANSTMSLSSVPSTTSQTVCINNAIADITYAIGGGGTGATVTAGALPTGVTGSYSGGVFTISGTPTTSGSFSYTVSASGTCLNNSLSGTMNVTANSTISLSSVPSTTSQTVCINNAITNITYTIGGGGTGASVTPGTLPTGVTGSYNAGTKVFTISGTPTTSGSFSYTVTTSGPCVNNSLSGTMTINANSTISLSSLAATTSQTVCINNAITNIVYTIGGGGTGASVTPGTLPAGVTGVYNAGVFTISGTPTASGTFNYTVTTAGPCVNNSLNGTITVTANSTITLSSAPATTAQTVCMNNAITSIIYTIGGGGTGASVTPGTLPTGVTGSYNSGTKIFTISGTPTTSGSFNYTVTTSGACVNNSLSGTMTVNPASVGGTVGANAIVCSGSNSGTLTLSGTAVGSVIRWESSVNDGNSWSTVSPSNTTPTLNYSNLVTSTLYRAVVQSGVCASANSTAALIAVNPPFTPIITAKPSTTICFGQSDTLIINSFNTRDTIMGGGFSNPAPAGWSGMNGNASNDNGSASSSWGYTNHGTYNGFIYRSNDNSSYMIVDGVVADILSTPAFSTVGRTALSLDWYQGYNFNGGSSGKVEISINGGTSWTTLAQYNSGSFQQTNPLQHNSIDLSAYLGQSNVKIRFNYIGTPGSTSGWGIDNVNLVGPYQPVTYSWSGPGFTFSGDTAIVSPPTGTHTYTITTLTGGCSATNTSITITVNPTPFVTSQTATACSGSGFTVAPTNGIGGNIVPLGTTYSWSAPSVTGGLTGGSSGSAASSITGTLINPTNTTQNATYTILALSGSCTGATFTVTVTVNPKPFIISQSVISCSGTGFTVSPANGVGGNILPSGTTYSWSAPVVTGGLSGGASGSGAVNIAGTLTNPTTTAQTATYTVTALSGSCAGATFIVTVTVNPVTIAGTLSPVSYCSGGAGILSLTGNVGGVLQWESSTTGAAPWTIIPATTTSLSITVVAQTFYYRALVQSGTCSAGYSNTATVGIHNYWTGVTSTDWFTTSNWSDGQLPGFLTCPTVTIPVVASSMYPILTSGTAIVNNLVINANASVTVTGGTLQIAGTITNNGTFDVSNGTIELNGTASSQTIATNTFNNHQVKNLVISNSTAAGVVLNDSLDIYRSLTYGTSGTQFVTNDHLTLKSTAAQTAWIGDMTNHTITGNVTVERYIGTGTTHAKSWQLLAIPTSGQTIKQSWQEGATATNVSSPLPGSAGNPFAGFGTMLTSNVPNAATQSTPGFDVATAPGPSIKVFNSVTNGYDGPTSTALPIYNQKGYFILVRGDRSVYTSSAPANPTVLRTKGTLFTPAKPPPLTMVLANKFESVGNPYASAIDLRSLSLAASGVNSTITVWDPTLGLGSANGLGAFQYLYWDGSNYVNLLPSSAYGPLNTANNYIQSGQAFIIQSATLTAGGTLTFTESAKASGSKLLARPMGSNELRQEQLRTNLYSVNANGNTVLTDGTFIQYNDDYLNSIDGMDARKVTNTSENLAVKTEGKLLSIERRHTIISQDTIFLNLTGVKVLAYRFEFIASNLNSALEGFLEDTYLHTKTPLNNNGTTVVNFTIVNIPGSYAPDRFRIVFARLIVMPVTFNSVKAYRQDKNINVEWTVENEMNIKQYEVEKSTNGTQFTLLAVKATLANGGHSADYVATDVSPVEGYNYYRVKSVDINGKTAYTSVVKVMTGTVKKDISIYPNPITDGMIHLQLMNQPEGMYSVRLMNKLGQVMLSKQINHSEGSSTEMIKWDYNLAHGMYQVEVTKPDGTQTSINVMY